MKIRFYPKRDAVLEQLREKLREAADDRQRAQDKLDKLNASNLFVQDYEKRAAQDNVDVHCAELKTLYDQITLLESHDPPEVMAELEV